MRRADKSALVFSAIVYEGVKAKTQVSGGPGGNGEAGEIVCISNRIVPGSFCLDTSVFSGWVLYPEGEMMLL